MLHVRAFHKSFNGRTILRVSEWLAPPGLHWIHGHNGSGKTTFFRCLAGELPFEGSVAFEGGPDSVTNPVAYRKLISFGEAEPTYPGFLTPADLLNFVRKVRNTSVEHENNLIERLGIQSFLHQPFSSCSSGMQKKVSLAITLLPQTGLLMLDEPFITLDVDAREHLIQIVREQRKAGRIILLSSHQDTSLSQEEIDFQWKIESQSIVPKS